MPKMRIRLGRVHSSYIIGIGTLVLLIFYLSSNDRDSRGNVDRQDKEREELKDSVDSKSDFSTYIREAEAENSERLQRIQQVCHRYNLGLYKHSAGPPKFKHPPTPQYSVFYIDREHKLTWCPIYKAASSTWLYNLCLLAGYSEEYIAENHKQINQLAREAFPELDHTEAEEAFHSTLKLMVVRHPFERLLSAYRDKLENTRIGSEQGTAHFYLKYGSRIVAKFRQGGNGTRTQSLLKPGQYLWDPQLPEPAGFEPTFKEFVRYLIDVDVILYSDDHWIPFYLFCTPCLLNYDIISKVETMLRDQVYVIRAAGLQGLIRPRWKHKTYSEDGKETSRRYFSQLSKQEVKRLYEKYKLDFELFDYKVDDYLQYATA
ncbi:carbohydrate sulfotransferase 11-like isoform X1 [Zootermopsis nevadensis]|nr:carbohydrate sulfotransferase 11-like isoform X1 [Zootermopsis nevadensis]